MQPKIRPDDIRWWFWLVTLLFIAATVAGVPWAHWVVIAISAIQVVFFVLQDKNLSTLAVQVRIVYFILALVALWPAGRLAMYVLLLLGTIMVTFFDRCVIAVVLKKMPWNEARRLRMN